MANKTARCLRHARACNPTADSHCYRHMVSISMSEDYLSVETHVRGHKTMPWGKIPEIWMSPGSCVKHITCTKTSVWIGSEASSGFGEPASIVNHFHHLRTGVTLRVEGLINQRSLQLISALSREGHADSCLWHRVS